MTTYDSTKISFYEKVWDLLVEHAGARPDDRHSFVYSMIEQRYLAHNDSFQTSEWRFQGVLGFGGKLYRGYPKELRVGFYREDTTPEREAIRDKVNLLLQELVARELP
jgi:hypothetical protein